MKIAFLASAIMFSFGLFFLIKTAIEAARKDGAKIGYRRASFDAALIQTQINNRD